MVFISTISPWYVAVIKSNTKETDGVKDDVEIVKKRGDKRI